MSYTVDEKPSESTLKQMHSERRKRCHAPSSKGNDDLYCWCAKGGCEECVFHHE